MRLTLLAALIAAPVCAQPVNEQDIAEGKAIFRSNCAFCHGMTGGGGRGPALNTGRFVHGTTDEDLKNVIRNGVPGTTMPAFETMDAQELARVIAFIRQLATGAAPAESVAGDAVHGRVVYQRSGCAGCHRIAGEGSVYGPELTRVGASRSAAYIRESIVDPSADIPEEFQGVTAVTEDGKRITGVRVNEDTFSVQLREPSQNFRMFDKARLRDTVHETKSLMPAYQSLAPADLNDLVAYLAGLRGELQSGAGARKAEGIH